MKCSGPLYTMSEARKELAKEDCANYGHEFRIVTELGRGPIMVVCDCGDMYDVVPRRVG